MCITALFIYLPYLEKCHIVTSAMHVTHVLQVNKSSAAVLGFLQLEPYRLLRVHVACDHETRFTMVHFSSLATRDYRVVLFRTNSQLS